MGNDPVLSRTGILWLQGTVAVGYPPDVRAVTPLGRCQELTKCGQGRAMALARKLVVLYDCSMTQS